MDMDCVNPEIEELLPDYLADARECLEVVSKDLLALDRGEEDPEFIQELFRQMHIIKGGASLMGFSVIAGLAHSAEDLLGAVKRGEKKFDSNIASVLLCAHDGLKALIEELGENGATVSDPSQIIETLRMARECDNFQLPDEPMENAAPENLKAPEASEESDAFLATDSMAAFGDESEEVLQEFFLESFELIEELDQDLVSLEENPEDAALLNKIFRAAHTLKGSSSFLGFKKISGVTHRVEDIFNQLRHGGMSLSPEIMDVILEAVDRVQKLLYSAQAKEEGPGVEDIIKSLSMITDKDRNPAPKEPASRKKEGSVKNSRTPSALVSAPVVNPPPLDEQEKDPHPSANSGLPPIHKAPPAEQTIRVDVERLDSLMNLVGELVLGKNRLARLRNQMEERWEGEELVEQLGETSSHIDLIASDLQLAVMKTRLVPIDKVFRKFPRMVRDLSRSLKKEIRLDVHGANTELDKSVVEVIGDPLVHIIRNCADHGIEMPEVRELAGKSREGLISLSACHEGNHIVVSVEDDGNGIDIAAVKQKALEKGIISPQEAAAMGEREACGLIFAPGFSTAKNVTSVSGRGVGMDVVKTNIQQVNGLVEIDAEQGKGTKVEIRIPLTLAIIQALLVRNGPEVYAVPLVSVLETVRITAKDIQTVDKFPVLRLRDQVVPLVRIDELFGVPKGCVKAADRDYVVVLGLAEKRVGLVVDGMVGEEEVVIKSLGGYLSDTPGIAGATIRGDGRVTLIVDVNQILAIVSKFRLRRNRTAA